MVCLPREWIIKGRVDKSALPDLKFTPAFRSLMKIRGLDTSGDVLNFLCPNLGQLRDPRAMKNMEKACERILLAI
ncbi:MAG TPA: hypothetical protein PLF54_11395, partial [Deltaproteobacteria bacterium]|nr:hypothetical protein [Deltaproteobacteria bacterium]